MARCAARWAPRCASRGKPPPNTMLADSAANPTCPQSVRRAVSSEAVLPAPGPPVMTTRFRCAPDVRLARSRLFRKLTTKLFDDVVEEAVHDRFGEAVSDGRVD